MKKYVIRDREAGNVIETVDTENEVIELIKKYESEDAEEGNYTPNFYEYVEVEE